MPSQFLELPMGCCDEGGGGVTSLNGLVGALTLVGGTDISITPSGSAIVIAFTGSSGSGTVTDVSVVPANGFSGTVATPTTTPAITLSTTITGVLRGNGTAISAQPVGNLTDVGTDGIVITGGTGAVLGSGTSIAQTQASASTNGYLSSADWSTFNGKQPAGNYITALTGDGTATGPGSVPFTLATVNSSPGTYTLATVTVNGKGLVTSASNGNAITSINGDTTAAQVIAAGTGISVATSSGTTTITNTAPSTPLSLTNSTSVYANSTSTIASVPANSKSTPALLTQSSSGAPTFGTNGMIGGVPVTNLKFVNATATTSSTGDLDLYTVPAGKRSLLMDVQLYNNSGGTINVYSEVKISGSYYGLQGSIAVTTGTAGNPGNGTLAAPILLEAGQSFSINTATNSGLNVWYQIAEFDNTAGIKSSFITTFTSGYNAVYTAPAGKTARLLSVQEIFTNITSASGQSFFLYAGTSGSFSVSSINLILNGGSGSSSNEAEQAFTVTSAHSTRIILSGAFGSGDFIAINSPTTTNTGAIAWVNVLEL